MSDSLENRRSLFEESQKTEPVPNPAEAPPPKVPFRELIALTAIVILCDLSIYRSYGYAGPSLMLFAAPVLLCLGISHKQFGGRLWLLTSLLVLISIRLAWCGSWLAVAIGFGLLTLIAMSLVGLPPFLAEAVFYLFHLIGAGARRLSVYFRFLTRFSPVILNKHLFAIGLPIVTLGAFGTIFIMANPDLVRSVADYLQHLGDSVYQWLCRFQLGEAFFCACAAWLAAGAFRPTIKKHLFAENVIDLPGADAESTFYAGYRNTLVSLIVLFAIYLVFEFETLWFKSFPKGFHYSGYAHEGAAWLTVALALATVVLSFMFRGSILSDTRLARLRGLSAIWSVENLLLSVAVFNRLFIYIGFNGMTRMRVIGMLGVASVVGGFLLVVRKIRHNQDFLWLIRRQLWTVAFAVYLYALLPVDAFVNWFNVDRIMKGNLAPSVQISEHPTTDEGYLFLSPLLQCSNEIIREGVTGLLEQKHQELQRTRIDHWTATQIASNRLIKQLETIPSVKNDYKASNQRQQAIQRFHDYSYQWY